MKYYINNKEVSLGLVKKYEDILIFCSTYEEHIKEGKEKYIIERGNSERIEELKNELLQLP